MGLPSNHINNNTISYMCGNKKVSTDNNHCVLIETKMIMMVKISFSHSILFIKHVTPYLNPCTKSFKGNICNIETFFIYLLLVEVATSVNYHAFSSEKQLKNK